MMAVAMDDATVIGVTEEVLRRWNCRREDVFNKPLAKFGTGTLSARYADDDGAPQKIEVTYAPPLGNARSSLFNAQSTRNRGTTASAASWCSSASTATRPRPRRRSRTNTD
jgi:hypothetical protein